MGNSKERQYGELLSKEIARGYVQMDWFSIVMDSSGLQTLKGSSHRRRKGEEPSSFTRRLPRAAVWFENY